jgi:hypothetical protein
MCYHRICTGHSTTTTQRSCRLKIGFLVMRRLNRILALKHPGFSLDAIEIVLGGLTLDQLRGMLKLRPTRAW